MFRWRKRGGGSTVLLIFGILGMLMACPMTIFGVPYSLARAREVAALPRPAASGLPDITIGETGLFVAQIPSDAPANAQGLALFYTETRRRETSSSQANENGNSNSNSWRREQAAPDQFELRLADGRTLLVTLPSSTTFMNAEQIEEELSGSRERRYTGYLPGQTLTIEGTREGDARATAETLYHGSPDAYVEAVRRAPGVFLIFGLTCGCLSLLMLGAGGVLKFLGR